MNKKAVNYEALLLPSTRIKVQIPKTHPDIMMHVYDAGNRPKGKGVVQVAYKPQNMTCTVF